MHLPVRPAMKSASIPTTNVPCMHTHRYNVLSGNVAFDTSKVYTEKDTRIRIAFIIGVRLLRSRDPGDKGERGNCAT